MRSFLIECSGAVWTGIARQLADEWGITPVLWSGDRATVDGVRDAFPGLVGVVGTLAACGVLPPEASGWIKEPLDGPRLRAMASDEAIGLSMMDRMDQAYGSFDHDARRRHWHDLLCQWSAALDALKPDVVFFALAPHAVYDYALYAVCKQRGVATRMFERTALPGLVYVVERFEEGSDDLRNSLRSLSTSGTVTLSNRAREHLMRLRGDGEESLPLNYRKKLKARGLLGRGGRQNSAGIIRTIIFELSRAIYLAIRRRSAPPNYMAYEDSSGRLVSPGLFGWLIARWRGQWKKLQLSRFHRALSHPVPVDRPYVLFALHYQPERAVVPMAGAFCDQILIVDVLAKTLPKGWTLVVKEHPWQLVPFGRGELGRSFGFYRRIADHANVALVSPDSDTKSLLKGARAVATVTGSIGWQAIACGIPVLTFGAAWYADAAGVYRADDLASMRRAMGEIANGANGGADAADRMLAAVEAVAVRGYLEPSLEAVEGIGEADAIADMSAALAVSLSAQSAARLVKA